jgi:hypothetical protein
MSLSRFDAPDGSYTSRIPRGTSALRFFLADRYDIRRTEVIRDPGRCAGQRSEHCECGAIDFFTTDRVVGRAIFVWCRDHADAFGIQSVIFDRRVVGFGNPRERVYTGPSPHTDHVHVGLDRWARANLTTAMLEGDDMTQEEHDLLVRTATRLDDLIVALGDKDPATAKAAWDRLGDARGDSLMNVAEAGRNYAKAAKENTDG